MHLFVLSDRWNQWRLLNLLYLLYLVHLSHQRLLLIPSGQQNLWYLLSLSDQ